MKPMQPGEVESRPKRQFLSFSRLSTFQACPLKFYFRYILGLPQEIVSSSLVFGTCFHAALECHFHELMIGHPPPDLDTLLDVFWDVWRTHEQKEIVFPKSENLPSLARLADRMLRTFQASALARPAGTITGVEETLIGELIPGLPGLLARVDLLVNSATSLDLVDFKTARTAWDVDQVLDAAGQLLLYHELVKPMAQGRPVHLSFAVFTKTKLPQLHIYPVRVDPHQVERTKAIVVQLWRALETGNFYPAPSPLHCPTCPYREPCRSWRG
jgi:putative RecB family exonuclease